MNFKKSINRKKNKERKWDAEFLAKEYQIDVTKKYYNLSIADLDFKSPKPVIKAIKRRAGRGTYSYTFSEEKSLMAIKTWYKKIHDIDLKIEWIKLVHGTVNAMFEFIKCFTNLGDSVLIQTPLYQPFERAIKKTNRKLVSNELRVVNNKFEIDFDDFEKQLVNNQVKAFMFCNPHNPGGRVWTQAEINRLVEICQRYNVIIFSDEVHGDLLLTKKHQSLLLFDNTQNYVVCNSPNKGFNLGGLKGSFMISPNFKICKKMEDQYENDSLTSPNVFFQPALQAAYMNEISYKWLQNLKIIIFKNFEYLCDKLNDFKEIEVMEMESSYLAWIKMNNSMNWNDLKNDFLNENLIFSYGSEFAGGNDSWLRINIGLSSKIFQKVIEKMMVVLKMWGIK